MKKNYRTPQISVIEVPCGNIMLVNSQGQTSGTIPDMGWGDKVGNSGGTVPDMGWGAAEHRKVWDDYENN